MVPILRQDVCYVVYLGPNVKNKTMHLLQGHTYQIKTKRVYNTSNDIELTLLDEDYKLVKASSSLFYPVQDAEVDYV